MTVLNLCNHRWMATLVGVAILSLLAQLTGCGAVPDQRSEPYLQAVGLNQLGDKAFRSQEYEIAIDYFNHALRLNESIEDLDGIAVARLNLAKCYQSIGKLNESHRNVDALLQEKVLLFSSEHLATAAILKSLLYLHQNDLLDAEHWIETATKFCGAQCASRGVLLNVRAGISLAQNDAVAAVHWGELAFKENEHATSVEHTNAMRLLARAKLLSQEPMAALPLLDAALAWDKNRGMTERMIQDMKILVDVYVALGNQDKVHEYTERAKRLMQSQG